MVLPDNTLVLASPSRKNNKIVVCVMHPGDRGCASTATLNPYHKGDPSDGFYATPQVLATGGWDVSVVVEDCCGANVFNSTNDGKTFSQGIVAGSISGVAAGTVANGQLVVGSAESSSLDVQAFPPAPKAEVTAAANPNGREDGVTSLTTYDGGVLVASDDTNGNTLVEFAPSGSNFNKSGSYKKVATFDGENLTGISGDALLTNPGGSLTGGEKLRFFNGSSFGASHKVPEPYEGDDGGFNLQDVGGYAHIFFLNRRHNYDVYGEAIRDGGHWSGLSIYNPADNYSSLSPVLNNIGSGVEYESAGTTGADLRAQPIMLPQAVHVSLAHAKVTVGTQTKLNGLTSVHLGGQTVTLEKWSGKSWTTKSTTHESKSGAFSFTVAGYTHTYRAVIHDRPGFYQFGYSNDVTLTAVPKKKK